MPTYEYECERCGTFEVEQKISDSPLTECPNTINEKIPAVVYGGGFRIFTCGKPVRRLIAGQTGFVLNGKGWFKDGY
jgi:putative FmdB family regulatory protein